MGRVRSGFDLQVIARLVQVDLCWYIISLQHIERIIFVLIIWMWFCAWEQICINIGNGEREKLVVLCSGFESLLKKRKLL